MHKELDNLVDLALDRVGREGEHDSPLFNDDEFVTLLLVLDNREL